MYKITLRRFQISKRKDDRGEYSTIGNFTIADESGNIFFKCYSVENDAPSSDESGKDHRIMPRVYKLQWNYTRTSVAKVGFRNVNFDKTKYKVKEVYHTRYKDYDFKNLGIQLINDDVKGFNDRWIFIHIANSAQDVEGCIGLGRQVTTTGVSDSTSAIQEFYDLVNKYGIENFTLEIKEII